MSHGTDRWPITDDLHSEVAKRFESRRTSKFFNQSTVEETFILDNESRGRIAVHNRVS
jgi:hypothetical protein